MFLDLFANALRGYEFLLTPFWLFIISFIEASISPIPPEVLLIPLCILDPSNALLYGAITTIASVLGALLGYWIGLKGGRPVLNRIIKQSLVEKAENYFNKHGAWAIGLAAFTPIPFKVFTIMSGTLRYRNIYKFILASAMGRTARFLSESIILMIYGKPILDFIQGFFQILVLIVVAIAILIIIIVKHRLK